ncbi:flavin reductase [Paraburkholderia youngii]|uniref:flavin reductase n=1 Tax=Paraburkholderia youngii TaxID=2782701 RepID=UPI003D1A9974
MSVRFCDTSQLHMTPRFSRASTDKFADLHWKVGMGGVPVLPGMAATFECEAEHRYDGETIRLWLAGWCGSLFRL